MRLPRQPASLTAPLKEELADVETDVPAGFVLAHAAPRLRRQHDRQRHHHLELIRGWFKLARIS
jgi:hypothetical protein